MAGSKCLALLVTFCLSLGGATASAPAVASAAATAAAPAQPLTGEHRIDADLRAKKISQDEALMYMALLVAAPQFVPREYQPAAGVRDQLPTLLRVLNELEKASPHVQDYIRYLFSSHTARAKLPSPSLKGLKPSVSGIGAAAVAACRPGGANDYVTPEGHFRFYYETTGTDGTTLGYVQGYGQYLEESLQYYQDHGYRAPEFNSDGELTVYMCEMGSLYGQAFPATIFTDAFMAMDVGRPTGAMQVTAAHELFHEVQFATLSLMSSAGESWWYESSATFMEDEIYDNVDDYLQYLPSLLEHTDEPLGTTGGGYETVLINKLLKEGYNGGNADIIRSVLEGIGPLTSAEESMDSALSATGANLGEAIHKFSLWNFFTGHGRSTSGYYEEASLYPEFIHFDGGSRSLGTATPRHEVRPEVDRLAAKYYRFTADSSLTVRKSATVEVEREDSDGRGWVVVRRAAGGLDVRELSFDAAGKAKVRVANFSVSTVDEVVVILSNGNLTWGDEDFKLTVSLDKPLDLIFLIDTTGSMWDDIANVQAATASIVDALDANSGDWRVAVAQYKDFPVYPYGESSDFPYAAALGFSNNKAGIITAVNTLSASGGWDWPESVYSGLMGAITTQGLGAWRPEAHKGVIVMGDAPPHDPEPFTGHTLGSVVAAAVNAGIGGSSLSIGAKSALTGSDAGIMGANNGAHIYSIVIGGDPDAYSYFSQLSSGTEGQVFRALNASEVVTAILNAIGSASDGAGEPPACEPGAALAWAAPLLPPDPYRLRLGESLDIKFGYADCGRFIRDESVVVLIQDQATMNDPEAYPVVAWVYGHDIAIDDAAKQYSVRFDASRYGVAAGTTLHVSVYFGDRLAGQALVVTE